MPTLHSAFTHHASKVRSRSYHPPSFISRSRPFNSTPFLLPHNPLISNSPPNHPPIFTKHSPLYRAQIPFFYLEPAPNAASTRPPYIFHSSSTRRCLNPTRLPLAFDASTRQCHSSTTRLHSSRVNASDASKVHSQRKSATERFWGFMNGSRIVFGFKESIFC